MHAARKPAKRAPKKTTLAPSTRSRYLALRYPELELVLDPLDRFFSDCRSAGFVLLRTRRQETTKHGIRLAWTLSSKQGLVRVVLHDDETMPAMVLEISGAGSLVAEIERHVEKHIQLASSAEVVAAAAVEAHEDPAMLVMAAWVAGEEEEAALLQLLR